MADNFAHPYNRLGQVVTIDVIPDDVLLTIFDFYVVKYQDLDFLEAWFGNPETKKNIESWQSLIHVCRRWRNLVFGSPRRLNLQLYCIPGTPPRMSLDVWPVLPLILGGVSETSVDDVIAELQHSDRICQINLINLDCCTTQQIEKLWTAMQVPFPELAVLSLSFRGLSRSHVPLPPDSFLGGSASRLRVLFLHSIPFPVFPKLLLSATNLAHLGLMNIPHSGYISPEAMVSFLSILTSLESFRLEFESPESCPDQEIQRPPVPTRSVLPALKTFLFNGVNEYLEELVTRIDAPQLRHIWTKFFNDIDFDTPELIQFITRTFEAPKDVHVSFHSRIAWVTLQRQTPHLPDVRVDISCREPDWQLSFLAQICTSSLPLLSTTENLYIYENPQSQSQLDWKDGIENTEWLELLRPFTAVKDLYLSKQFAPRIAPALQDLTGERTMEVLPTLQNIFLEGFQPSEPVHDGIGQFISVRQLTNRPVAILTWERDLERERSMYTSG